VLSEQYSVILGKGLIALSLLMMFLFLCFIVVQPPLTLALKELLSQNSTPAKQAPPVPIVEDDNNEIPNPELQGSTHNGHPTQNDVHSNNENKSVLHKGAFEIIGNPAVVLSAKASSLDNPVMLGKTQGDEDIAFSASRWMFTGEYTWISADDSDDGSFKSFYGLTSTSNEKYWIAGEYIYKPTLRKLIGTLSGTLELSTKGGGSESFGIKLVTGYGHERSVSLSTVYRGVNPIFSQLFITGSNSIIRFDPRFQEEGGYFILFLIDDGDRILRGIGQGNIEELQLEDMSNFLIHGRFTSDEALEFVGDIYITKKATTVEKLAPGDHQKIVPANEEGLLHVGTITLSR
jgi:hypothetical protein